MLFFRKPKEEEESMQDFVEEELILVGENMVKQEDVEDGDNKERNE